MTCENCGNRHAFRMSIRGKKLFCDTCGDTTHFKFSDVFFNGPYFDSHIAHPETSPKGNYIRSREHKADLMRAIGITEIGDKRHGTRARF